jgi:hypothetical protein
MTSERIHYTCVCDEGVSLRCANQECETEIEPGKTIVVTADGGVYCSEACTPPAPSLL